MMIKGVKETFTERTMTLRRMPKLFNNIGNARVIGGKEKASY